MGLAEAAVLEDPEAGQAGEDGRDDVDFTDPIPRGDLLVAKQGDESCGHGDQSYRGMNHAALCQSEHVDFPLEPTLRLRYKMSTVSPLILAPIQPRLRRSRSISRIAL